ncbi:MAG: hypothetical protein ACRDVP_04380 [Acidimicrobiales bacterium]
MWVAKVNAELEVLEKVRAARRRLVEAGHRTVRWTGESERVALPNAHVLPDVAETERATTVIEVGLAQGASALAIAEALASERTACIRHLIVGPHPGGLHEGGVPILTTVRSSFTHFLICAS